MLVTSITILGDARLPISIVKTPLGRALWTRLIEVSLERSPAANVQSDAMGAAAQHLRMP